MLLSITLFIILITVGTSLLAFSKRELFYKFEYNPYLVHHQKQWARMLTHGLVHGDWVHLFVNMYVLYGFGTNVERYFGEIIGGGSAFIYLALYIGGVLFAALPGFKRHKNNPQYNAVGASGAVAAVLFSFIVFNPMAKISLLFIPIGIPAFIIGALYLAYEYYLDKKGGSHIAHDAHLWGAIFGVVFTIAIKPELIPYFFERVFGSM